MDYRQRRTVAIQELLDGFEPDLARCKKPELVKQAIELTRAGLYTHEIAERLGVTPKTIQKIYRRYNLPSMHNFFPPLREERRGWQGGVKIVKGYAYSRTPGHPYGSKHGNYVAVHRLVYEQHLGRYLTPHEVIHHLDGNPLNNNIENLGYYASNGEHLRETLAGKCPNWSEDGRKKISAAARAVRQREALQRAANRMASGTCASL